MNQHVHSEDDPVTKGTMRQLPLFASLSEADLDTLYHMTRTVTVPAGHVLMEEGGPPDSAYVIVDGELEISTRRAEKELLIAVRHDGDLVGEMSLLEQAPRSATVRARRQSCLLQITQAALETLIGCSRAARWAILAGVASRLRGTQTLLDQSARMAQLGELAADLAHEINNPAAAVRRSVAQLRDVLDTRDGLAAQLARGVIDTGQLEALANVQRSAARHTVHPPRLDALTHADREDELLGWLEERDVPRSWEVAEVLASYGWTTSELADLVAGFDVGREVQLVQLAADATRVYGLLDEIARSAEGITERVQAVKEYAFLDQAPVQPVDLHHSLDTTLLMLRNKLKPGIVLRREYAADLPRIQAYGSELNQVWTNLIDNALDAIGEAGELVVRTAHADGFVRVEVIDSGPGIPADIVARIFDVGFTTKPPGEGSGRGLHIARNIVADKHRGQITVASRPGETRFEVLLPVELPRG
jgi:signal transduction histidine kinase